MNFKSFPYHPILIGIFQILSIASININEVSFGTIFYVLFIFFLLTVFLFLVICYAMGQRIGAIIISLNIFIFFLYGRVLDYFIKNPIAVINLTRNRNLLPIFLCIMFALSLYIYKNNRIKNNLKLITKYLNQFSIGLVFVSILTMCIHYDWTLINRIKIFKGIEKKVELMSKLKTQKNLKNRLNPNIYFLIFDSYPSQRVLDHYYSFNDSGFVNNLISRGFNVNQNARSNYCFTGASITSTLSMRFLHLDNDFKTAYNQDNYISKFYDDNYVTNRLELEGYDIVSNFNKEDKRFAYRKSLFLDDFVQLIIHLSMFRIIENELIVTQLRSETQSKIQFLKEFDPGNKPVFVAMHIMVPHSPFIFRQDGSRPTYFESDFGKFEDKEKFLEQVRFTSSEIIKIIDKIQFNDPSAIMIIQADHGYGGEDDMIYLNRNSTAALNDLREQIPPSNYLDQRFGILSAIYSPIDLNIKENSTPVNLFRFIFNKLFNENNEYLPDNSYFTLIKQPYIFHNITDSLDFVNKLSID